VSDRYPDHPSECICLGCSYEKLKKDEVYHQRRMSELEAALSAAKKEAEELRKKRENPCSKIFDHKWLDPECVESGCKSLRAESAEAERDELLQWIKENGEHPEDCGVNVFVGGVCKPCSCGLEVLAKPREGGT
jgi:hypothetical protein